MGRDANLGQQILKRDGKLVGFNAGFGPHAEHERGYRGCEQENPKKSRFKSEKENPFNGEIVQKPDDIKLMEFEDGTVWMTNDGWRYAIEMAKTEDARKEFINRCINNRDRLQYEEWMKEWGKKYIPPEVIALWNDCHFDLISTNERSSELLKTLYNEIQKRNVAISSDYSFMFENRGLSFVLLDQLTNEDLANKQLVDNRIKMAKQFKKEYIEYLSEEGLDESVCYGNGGKYPAEFWNVQVSDLITNYKR